jgi:hypothetical protein
LILGKFARFGGLGWWKNVQVAGFGDLDVVFRRYTPVEPVGIGWNALDVKKLRWLAEATSGLRGMVLPTAAYRGAELAHYPSVERWRSKFKMGGN